MKICVITAMPVEFNIVARCVAPDMTINAARPGTLRGRTSGHDAMVIQSGMGFDNAARATEKAVREERPDLLISTGFCGGITPDLQAGDIVVAREIVVADEGSLTEIQVQFSDAGRTVVAHETAAGRRTVGGTFVSTRAITSKRHLAGLLSHRHPVLAVEMESGAIATVAAENNIPLLALRAVSDCADEELAFSLDEFCDPALYRILPRRVLLTILRKPHIIPQLMRLSRSSGRAAKSLEGLLSRLFPLL